jgi:hypothetical protein
VSYELPFPPFDRTDAGYRIEANLGAEHVTCREVRGFGEAFEAACDPRAPAPPRLVLAGLDAPAVAWLERWAEDTEQVRRALSIRRDADGAQVAVVATLSSHGFGVPTSLAVESVRAGEDDEIRRSGVHLKVDVMAALAGYLHDPG